MLTNSTCHAICVAESFRQDRLRDYFKVKSKYNTQIHPDYMHIKRDQWGEAFVFMHGSIVFWGVGISDVKQFLKVIARSSIDPYEHREEEIYNLAQESGFEIVDSDIIMEHDSEETKVAVSFALAQAVTLKHYESIIAKAMPDLITLPTELAKNGKISISKKKALKKTGEIFLVRAQINLHSDLLDTPEYFWERTDQEESIYNQVIQEIDLRKRIRKLNHRLDIIQSTYDLLRAHIEHKDGVFLETTIIVLILIEIIFMSIQYMWPPG